MTDETITIVYGEEVYSPVTYNNYKVGPYTYTTTIRPGETFEQAFERGYNLLAAAALRSFNHKRQQFKQNYAKRQGE